jgi:predicted outer membrane repeat protein
MYWPRHGGGPYYYGVLSSTLNVKSTTSANNQATDAGGGLYSDSEQEDVSTI